MNYGRCYHLAYHHRKARVRKKNLHRFQRRVRKECKKGKTLIEVMPYQLKAALRNAPAIRDDRPYPADGMCWWSGQTTDDYSPYKYPLFSIGGMWPHEYPDPYYPKPII